jgi:DNA-binding transcriptional ArsR family regulator
METVLKALAEPRRVEILRVIGSGETPAGKIAAHFDLTRPAISQHLRVLVDAKLINERREGTKRLYSVRPESFAELRGFLEEFWDTRLARLKQIVEEDPSPQHTDAL